MSKSQQSFNKREKEKKRRKKKQEKEERRKQRKMEKEESGKKTFEEMLSYVDENGNLTSTPPDPTKKKKVIKAEDIVLGIPSREKEEIEIVRSGKVKFFNFEKGYGFIEDATNRQSLFVHIGDAYDQIQENDKVTFEVGDGPKGPKAILVKLATG